MPNLVIFTGRVPADLTLQSRQRRNAPHGEQTKFVQFALMRSEYAGTDKDNGERRDKRTVSPYFTMFGSRAESFCKHVFKGDEITVTARITTEPFVKEGKTTYPVAFIVDDFEFGAPGVLKREHLAAQGRGHDNEPPLHDIPPHPDDEYR